MCTLLTSEKYGMIERDSTNLQEDICFTKARILSLEIFFGFVTNRAAKTYDCSLHKSWVIQDVEEKFIFLMNFHQY